MHIDQLTPPPHLDDALTSLGRLSVADARDLLESAAEAIDVDALAETVSDAGAVAAEVLGDVVAATGTVSLAGGRLARVWAVRAGRVVARRPRPFAIAAIAIGVAIALALWRRSAGRTSNQVDGVVDQANVVETTE